VDVTGLQYSALSYHLKHLKDAGLISFKKEGNFWIYSLTPKGEAVHGVHQAVWGALGISICF